MILEGAFTALVTPFTKTGSLDEKALRKLVRFQIDSGINGLVPMGTTGESPTLSAESHIRVIEITLEESENKAPIIAGTGSNSTKEAVELSIHAMECGASACLQVAPYYNKPTQEGLYRHFMEIADSADIPQVLYNIPSRCGISIDTETIVRLSKHPNIIAIKEASGSISKTMEISYATGPDFTILSGDDNLTLPICFCGGKGVISVAANIMPKQIVKLVSLCNSGNIKEAHELNKQLFPFFKTLFVETNPGPIKYIMAQKGLIEEIYRLPLCELSKENKASVNEELKRIKDYLM